MRTEEDLCNESAEVEQTSKGNVENAPQKNGDPL